MLVRDVEFHQRSAAHAVDHDCDFVTVIVDSLCEDLVEQLIGDAVDRADLFTVSTRFTMDTDTDFDFIFRKVEALLAGSRYGAGFNCHTHGTNVCDNLFRNCLDVSERSACFGARTCELVNEDGSCDTAAAGCPCGVFNRNVICDNDLVNFDAFVSGHVRCHFKVHYITRVILDNEQYTLTAVGSFDCLIDLVRCRGGEYCAGYCRVQHTFSDESAVCRFMAASAAGYESYFAFGTAGTDKNLKSGQPLYILRAGSYHAFQHFVYYIVDFVNQFLHTII